MATAVTWATFAVAVFVLASTITMIFVVAGVAP